MNWSVRADTSVPDLENLIIPSNSLSTHSITAGGNEPDVMESMCDCAELKCIDTGVLTSQQRT